jgi:uncharacterized membrane protein
MRYVQYIDPFETDVDRTRIAQEYLDRKQAEREIRKADRYSIYSIIGAVLTGMAMAYILFG